jgi:enamine deaminase RidA (YjgF/YER057c/UK114 family)
MYLTDLRDYHAFTEVLPKYFPEHEPAARTVFEVSNIVGPVGAKFEIEAIAAAK